MKGLEIDDINLFPHTLEIDDFNLLCNMSKVVHLELLDGPMLRVNVHGVFYHDEHGKDVSIKDNKYEFVWDWWDSHIRFISSPGITGDLDIFLIDIENSVDLDAIHYGIKRGKVLPGCYVHTIAQGENILGWEETLFISTMLELPTLPTLSIQKVANTTKELYIQQLEAMVSSVSLFGSTSNQHPFNPRTKKGILIRNYFMFHSSNMSRNVLLMRGYKK